MDVLIFNVGSSSLKWTALREDDSIIAEGNERPGDHSATSLREAVSRIARRVPSAAAVGHRVVHGGSVFRQSVVVDDAVRSTLDRLSALDPLHMQPALALLDAARAVLSGATHVAAFDTAFHRTMDPAYAGYALPQEWCGRMPDGIEARRYGFHGLSVEWSVERLRRALGTLPRRLLVAHLGSGCSITAVHDGQSVDTTMGFTPLDGLMMGTRPGAVDPGLLLFLQRECGLNLADLQEGLEHKAGLLGVSGASADLRDVLKSAAAGDQRAQLAWQRFVAYGRRSLGAMSGSLGGADAVVFTGGIGEHSPRVRRAFMQFQRNHRVRVFVLRAREDLIVARDTRHLLAN